MLRPYIPLAGPGPMTDRRRQTRLLALLPPVLAVLGLTAVYGASRLLTTPGSRVGPELAERPALGAVAGGHLAPLLGVLFLEPNLSMALLVAILAGVVLFTAGARIGHFLVLGVVGTPLAFGAVASAQYRIARVLTFLAPGSAPAEATWQVHQSLVGIGAGRLFGVGLGQGQQKLGYLPYAYSDFIFSTIGEEWGFIGVVVILVLFGTFVWLGFRIARSAGDLFGQLLAVGLTALIGVSAALHIGVSLALLPATGVTLPFISYGRSSLLVALVATGVLISVGRGRRRTDGVV